MAYDNGGLRSVIRYLSLFFFGAAGTSNNQQHATVVGGGGDGRRRTKTMIAAAIAAAMAEEVVGRQRLWRLQWQRQQRQRQEQQNSGAGIILPLANVVCSRTVLLGEQWQYFGVFFSVCTRQQIICETNTDTRICRFNISKYNPQIKTWLFCKDICVSM
jgi:hypothetical protein